MHAGFDWYRANFSADGLAQAKTRAAKRLTMPVLALGGSEGVGETRCARLSRRSRTEVQGADHGLDGVAAGQLLPPEECPAGELTAAVLNSGNRHRHRDNET